MKLILLFFIDCSTQNRGNYEEEVVPEYIQTVTAPTLDKKAYGDFKFQRSRLHTNDQDFPSDNIHQGKTYHHTKRLERRRVSQVTDRSCNLYMQLSNG